MAKVAKLEKEFKNRIVGYAEVDPEQLLAHPENFRLHPDSQQQALAGAIDSIGYIDPVLVNKNTDTVIDGHLRVSLALRSGVKSIPVTYVDLTEDEERQALLMLDPIAALAASDKTKLDELLRQVNSDDERVQQMLADLAKANGLEYGDAPPEDPGAQIDKAEELREKWGVELGQLWQLGEHRLICGDCTDKAVVDKVMGGEKAQLVYTDPPYGVDYDGGTKVREKLSGDATTDLYMPACQVSADYSDEKAALYLWHAGVKGIAAAAAAAAAGYQIRCEIVWNKNHAQFGALSAQYKQKHEPLYYCFKSGNAPRWFGPKNEVTVWDCNRSNRNDYHPTQKPVELAERAINNSSEINNIISDWFLGSGATLIACERLNRKCRAVEISPAYCAVAIQRWVDMTGGEPVLVN